MYDIVYILDNKNSVEEFNRLKVKFPLLKKVKSDSSVVDAFLTARTKSFTELVWIIWPDVTIDDSFNFDYKVSEWDKNYVHLFENGNYYDGICLVPKHLDISKKEITYRFFTNKKEIDVLASTPKPFDKFYINTYNEYLKVIETSTTNMFWVIWDNIEVDNNFKFNYQVPYYEQHITHVFKNGDYYDGVCLFSKKNIVSKKEFEYRFFTNKKEVDIVVSHPKPFEVHYINSYEEYLNVVDNCLTAMFYVVFSDLNVISNFNFNYQVPYYEQHITHVFKNGDYYDGVCLFSKNKTITTREFEHRFFTNKKEIDVLASTPKPFDIVFVSYNEPNAEENWNNLQSKFPRAKRVHGVKGIHQAHIEAAKLSDTEMLWVVDGDAIVVDDFDFKYQVVKHNFNAVHVWRSRNPINDLEYGYGGVKLLPRELTLKIDVNSTDMTTSISPKFVVVDRVSNITAFNTDPFNTWKSAFRECAKLASNVIDRQISEETQARLNAWCTTGKDKPFGNYAIAGAVAGKKFAEDCPKEIYKINDFDWLYEQFSKYSL